MIFDMYTMEIHGFFLFFL